MRPRLAVVLVVVTMATPARADDAIARDRYARGVTAYNLQEFPAALALFREAYVEQPDPALLFNIAQCQRQLGQHAAAARSYRAYLEQVPAAANYDEAARLAEQMDDASKHQRAVEAAPATVAPAATLSSAGANPPWYRSPTGWVLLGTGGASVAIGAGLAVRGGEIDAQIPAAGSLERVQQLQQDRDVYRSAGWALLAIGGAEALTGSIVMAVRAARARGGQRW